MDRVRADFVARHEDGGRDRLRHARAALGARLSAVQLHLAAHQPRKDEYGGTIERRMRFPLEVFDAVRAAWPKQKPISVRISATDWSPGGLTPEDTVAIGRAAEGARRRHHRRLRRPDRGRRQAGLRSAVPNALLRAGAPGSPRPHHDRRQHPVLHRRQQHHRRRPRGPVRAGACPPLRSVLDAPRRPRAGLGARNGPISTRPSPTTTRVSFDCWSVAEPYPRRTNEKKPASERPRRSRS